MSKSMPVGTAILLTDKEAAMLLGISSKHFRNLVASGNMPKPIRLGRSVRWRKTDIENAVQKEVSS